MFGSYDKRNTQTGRAQKPDVLQEVQLRRTEAEKVTYSNCFCDSVNHRGRYVALRFGCGSSEAREDRTRKGLSTY